MDWQHCTRQTGLSWSTDLRQMMPSFKSSTSKSSRPLLLTFTWHCASREEGLPHPLLFTVTVATAPCTLWFVAVGICTRAILQEPVILTAKHRPFVTSSHQELETSLPAKASNCLQEWPTGTYRLQDTRTMSANRNTDCYNLTNFNAIPAKSHMYAWYWILLWC